ncbi:MAG TPA: hypothetical protein VHC97_02425 [Thermoanaerobaculia bacterium]|jgi:hypothetical protein|nr:hypothetical protein [Thermoanaerobaculia bacterium]
MKPISAAATILMLVAASAAAQTVEGFGKGLVDRNYPHVGALLLDSFDFQFTKDRNLGSAVDHHLQQILIAPDFGPGRLRLGYHDKNSDDEYFYRISHLSVDNSRIQSVRRDLDICSDRGKCTVHLNKPAGDFVFVLVGFQLSFRGTDHHIDEVGILENNGDLTVFFNDKNDDDIFIWSIQFAWVPRDSILQLGESSGAGDRKGASRTIPHGSSVIRGFKFNFRDSDHHIRATSVLTPDGRVEVLYTDQNGDDPFDWQVRWAILPTPPPRLTVRKVVSPASDPGRFNLQIDGVVRASGVGNGGSTGALEVSAGAHTVSDTAAPGTNLANYTRTIGGDCASSGAVTVAAGQSKTCTITSVSVRNPDPACAAECEKERKECMAGVGQPGGFTPAQCAKQRANCLAACPPQGG